eukprot:5546127-Amphidinium_carterae.1
MRCWLVLCERAAVLTNSEARRRWVTGDKRRISFAHCRPTTSDSSVALSQSGACRTTQNWTGPSTAPTVENKYFARIEPLGLPCSAPCLQVGCGAALPQRSGDRTHSACDVRHSATWSWRDTTLAAVTIIDI